MPLGRTYAQRIASLGWPLVSSALALVVAAIALAQPIWALEQSDGAGTLTRVTYAWTKVIEEVYVNGVWDHTTERSYTGPTFTQFRMREAVGTAYLVGLIFVIAFLVFALLQFFARSRKIPANAVTAANIVALGLGFVSVGLPALSIPAAAVAEIRSSLFGFFGGTTSSGIAYAWGPGLGWWLWLVATLAALVVFVMPYVQRRPSLPLPARR